MNQPAQTQRRYPYLDFLRILAAFLVIVNHTNSLVFKNVTPENGTWWISILWYYLSKIAVPMFVMVSGACLLSRQDTYRKAFSRFFRILIALVLFSYGYYLVALIQTGWSWSTAFNIPAFIASIWQNRITDSYWYLYFYLGLMVMLPILQRLASAMKKRDIEYFIGVSFLTFAVWPLVTHYIPALTLPDYYDVSLFGVFIGLFFAGYYLHTYIKKGGGKALNLFIIVVTLAASLALTVIEYARVDTGAKYWFMDERTAPSIFVILCAMAVMLLAKQLFAIHTPLSPQSIKRWAVVGGCAFGIYLLQDLIIAQTRYRLFMPLQQLINPWLAALVWEALVFSLAYILVWLLKKIPLLRRIL